MPMTLTPFQAALLRLGASPEWGISPAHQTFTWGVGDASTTLREGALAPARKRARPRTPEPAVKFASFYRRGMLEPSMTPGTMAPMPIGITSWHQLSQQMARTRSLRPINPGTDVREVYEKMRLEWIKDEAFVTFAIARLRRLQRLIRNWVRKQFIRRAENILSLTLA